MNQANIEFAEKSESQKMRLRCLELTLQVVSSTNDRLISSTISSGPVIEIAGAERWVVEAGILYAFVRDGHIQANELKNPGKPEE